MSSQLSHNTAANNKRIAINTIYLYFRMFITLIVGLYTSRVVLSTLGVSDFGLNNVVTGFVSMFGFLNGLLSQGTSRFLTMGLGKGDIPKLRNTFTACLTIHALMALAVLVFGETFGLWFVNNEMNIDPTRIVAANWIFQFALFGACLSIMQVPYSASVISHEHMSVYAYMSIFDVVMKLLIVYLLVIVNEDKLILFGILTFLISTIDIVIYRIYCHRKFAECVLRFTYDKKLYREIFDYIGWNTIGAVAFTLNGQGINVLLNMFFGTVVNAARGIASTIVNMLNNFVLNFQTAVGPQVIKYHAAGNDEQMNQLVCNNSKYSALLFIVIGLPVFFEAEYLIHLWLEQVPDYVVPFIRISMIQILIQAMDFPVGGGIHAFGKMKLPNLTSSIVYLSIIPITYFALKLGADPVISYIVGICVYPVAWMFDLWVLHRFSGLSVPQYFVTVIFKVLFIMLLSLPVPYAIISFMPQGFLRLIILGASTFATTSILALYLGVSKDMRIKVFNKIKTRIPSLKYKE